MVDFGAVALDLHGSRMSAPGEDDEEENDFEAFAAPQPPQKPRRGRVADPEDPEPGLGSDDEFDVSNLGLEHELLENVVPEREKARAAGAPQPAAPIDGEMCKHEEDLRPGEPGEAQRRYELANRDAILAGEMPRWKPPATCPTAASVASSLAVMMSLGGVNISVHVQNRFDRLKQLARDKEDYWALLDQSTDASDPDHNKVKKALQCIGVLNKWRIKTPRPPSKDNYPQSAEGAAKYEAAKVRYHGRLAKREKDRRDIERFLASHFPDRGQYLKQLHQERQDAGIRFSNDSREMYLAKRYGGQPDVSRVKEHEARKAEEAAKRKETPAKKKELLRSLAARVRVLNMCSGARATEGQMLQARQNANKRCKARLNSEDRKERDDKRAADQLATGAAERSNAYREMMDRLERAEAAHLACEQAYGDEAAAYLAERRAKKDKRDRDALDVAERRELRDAELAAARVFSSARFAIDQETGERLDPHALHARYEKARAREFQAVKRRKEARDEFYRTHIDDLDGIEVHIVLHSNVRTDIDWESPVALDNLQPRVSDTSAGSSREHAGKA